MSDTVQLADQYLLQSSLKADPVVKISKEKRVVEVPDIQQGNYSAGSITIDAASALNGSQGFASLRDGYLILPYTITMQNRSVSSMSAAANRFSLGLKCNAPANIIDSLSVTLNGQEIVTQEDFKMYWNHLRAQTEWSHSEVVKHGADTFLYPDDYSSMGFNTSTNGGTFGDGFVNNGTYVPEGLATSGAAPNLQVNRGYVSRLLANPPQVGVNTYGWPTISSSSSATIANQHARGAFIAGSGTAGLVMGTWCYMIRIPLVDLHPIFKELDLCANPQLKLRLRINTGFVEIGVAEGKMKLNQAVLSSGNTVPFMVSSCAAGHANAGVIHPSNVGTIRVAFGAVHNSLTSLADVGAYYPNTQCMMYLPFYDIANPQALISKPVKTCRYLDCFAQMFSKRAGLGVSSSQQNVTFNFQLSGTWKNVKYVALVPFAETSSGGFSTATDIAQYASPFDSAPWTCQPGSSIRQFQVQIGNQNAFSRANTYDYEQFLDDFSYQR